MEPSWPRLHGQPILLVPQAKETRSIPLGARDRKGHLGQAVIGSAVPGKTIVRHHYPLRPLIPLPDQNRAGTKLSSLLVKVGQTGGRYRASFLRNRSVQHLPCLVSEVTKAIGLEPIGDDREQQMPRQMIGRRSLKDTLPA